MSIAQNKDSFCDLLHCKVEMLNDENICRNGNVDTGTNVHSSR